MHPFIAAEYARVHAEDRQRAAAEHRLARQAAPLCDDRPGRRRRIPWRWRVSADEC